MKIQKIGEPKIIISNPDSYHNYFAWPTVSRLQNGKIAVVASGFRLAHVCPFGKAVISYSENEGESYTVPAPIIDTPLDDRDAGILAFGESNVIVTSFNNKVEFQMSEKDNAKYGGDAYGYKEAWGGVSPKYIFSTNNEKTVDVPNGELLFGVIVDIADEATVDAVAEKYGIEQVQGEDGTWYYPFPIHLDTAYEGWEWLNASEINVYPDGLKLVETSYIKILADAPYEPTGLYVQMEGRGADGSEYIKPGASGADAAMFGLVPYETNGDVSLGIHGKYKLKPRRYRNREP